MASAIDIVNVHAANHASSDPGVDLRKEIVVGLSKPLGHKSLPTMLLYDEHGLRLYDDITTKAPEYYPFPAEEDILKRHVVDIVRAMHALDGGQLKSEEVVVELGAGALRKTSHILSALASLVPATMHDPITYYALDLQERELERTLKELRQSDVGEKIHGKVATRGLCGTYDDGLQYIQEGGLEGRDTPPSTPGGHSPLHILFLGSSLGNFTRGEDAAFLRSLPLRPGSGDTLLLGLDHGNDPHEIEVAYNDPKGITKAFIMNGLKCAGKALGDEELFSDDKWEYVGRYNEQERRHEAFYKSLCTHSVIDPVTKSSYSFAADELVRIEVSYKYSECDAYSLFAEASLRPIQRWTDSTSKYSLWLLERPSFMFPLLKTPASAEEVSSVVRKSESANTPFGMPTIEEWKDMWAAWDFITQRMIPQSMLFQKPIDLRHICLFYLGHIPTFLSIHLSRLLAEPDTEPIEFKYIFERGIDPIVDDPTQCHPHSEVPQRDEDWPSMHNILTFQYRVRQRIFKLYDDIDSGAVTLTRKIARVLFMTLEHEAFHAETLLYMLLQRAGTGTIPPSGFSPPVWDVLAESWDRAPPPKTDIMTLEPATLTIGHDDDEADDASTDIAGHEFGWDNEHPKREVHVGKFKIECRPVTNGEFYEYYNDKGKDVVDFPASWIQVEGETHVRTLYGPVPMKIAWHWPIITSYDNLSTYASVKGGRIPTEPELRLFFDMFECGYEGGANIGFRNWHPIPATMGGEKDGGKGHNGGVWEWTSDVLAKHEGFIPSRLYPGYSTDFFDGKHQVVIGGSYVTVPRQAGRRALRNYYQHNYPYAWVGARIAYDV
ncbi:hypothetical protein POSPLADRAFT_1186655 [Postia placenta MAD-698-R-SB12]|uniref:Sulfatase-modifying factor enzyme domain-containing protein n=1 Tax=Postia placenta MAD-698-R-SB12 TaxID=670580 RepID=A0A1X6MJ85_9APHY|nr:hypothetical protein POSPLADRAFT_1186655 [Postia placenta MAD-698-R-SB12]OSX56507.1 hypothetical protein POSPLADRAFT_1186655 [Postia placenta MAD-698-R-SB12]